MRIEHFMEFAHCYYYYYYDFFFFFMGSLKLSKKLEEKWKEPREISKIPILKTLPCYYYTSDSQ